MKGLLAIGLLIGLPFIAAAQDYPRKEIDLQSFVEELFQVQDEDINYEDLYESLYTLYINPLDLNSATIDELQALFVLSTDQINAFFDYRTKNGRLLSIYELQSIPGFDLPTIYRIVPFVNIRDAGMNDNRPLIQRILSEPNNYWVIRYERTLEEKKGYTAPELNSDGSYSSRYLGSPDKLFSRFRVSHPKDFSLGFTLEKDPGEQIIWNNTTKQYGFDFYSAHFALQNKGRVKSFVLGDYQIQLGQSLLLGAGFSAGKGGEAVSTTRRSNLGVRPFTSVLEANYFRGTAITYALGKIDLTAFYSNLSQDANVQRDTLETEDFFSGVQTSGFHRTPNELANKSAVNEQTFGANLFYRNRNGKLQLGLTHIQNEYSAIIQKSPNKYNQFDFTGSSNYNSGIYFSYIWQNFNFFGETARSASGGIGAVAGMVASLSKQVDMSVVLRNYDKNFHSFYGAAFGEASRNINERGVYWGIKVAPFSKLWFNAYFDKFQFPWLTYRTDSPSEGYEYLIRVNYQPSRKIMMNVQFREEGKERNTTELVPIKHLENTVKRNYILNLDYASSLYLSFKSRVQWSDFSFEGNKSKGYAIMQDLNFEKGNLKLGGRIALFDAPNADNRQYVYERDVLYAFSIPAYSGRGVRSYLVLQYNVSRNLSLYARAARTTYRDRDVVGSGLEEIDGNIRTDFKFQVRYKF